MVLYWKNRTRQVDVIKYDIIVIGIIRWRMKMREKIPHFKQIIYGIIAIALVGLGLFITRDTQPPEITAINQTINYGTELSFSDLATIQDNRSKELEISILSTDIEGITVDNDKQSIVFDDTGTYEIKLSATDKAGNESQGSVAIEVIDSEKPELIAYDSNASVGYNSELKLCLNESVSGDIIKIQADDKSDISANIIGVKAADGNEVQEDSYKLNADETSISFADLGKYVLTFAVTDEFGNSVSEEVQVDVIDKTAPVITSKQDSFSLTEKDEKADYLAKLTAKDEIDGNLTRKIEVDDSSVKYGSVGEYKIHASVSDKSGNVCQKAFSVVIKDTTAPVISLSKDTFTLTEGDSAPDYKDIVTAKDSVDGDVTESIEINDSEVNYDSPGTYTVSYKVSDSSGNSSTKKVTVKVEGIQNQNDDPGGSDGSGSGGGTVLITRTGECYHTHKCGNGTYFPVSLSEALSRGLRPCKKCY